MKRVYFFEFWHSSPHLDTALELAQLHLEKNDEVHFYFGGHELTHCRHTRVSPEDLLVKWGLYKLPERRGADLVIGSQFYFYPRMDLGQVVHAEHDCSVASLEDLPKYCYGNYRAGLSVLSSLVSETRCSEPDFLEYREMIQTMLRDGESIYEFVINKIEEKMPDLVYVFNGRFYECRAVLDAARLKSVPVKIHERGASLDRYSLRDCMPHDRMKIQAEMIDCWEQDGKFPSAQLTARGFFEGRREGVEQNWKSYTRLQSKNLLPEIDVNRRTVTYFSSSDDEYVAVGDIYKWESWDNQFDAFKDLLDICRTMPDVQLILRIHPHLAEKSAFDRSKWLSLSKYSELTVLEPESPVDSYALIEASDVVVSAGSTVGIESVFWGTPSINLGPSLYSQLEATYQPQTSEELAHLLGCNKLDADPERTLPYGYYMSVFGTPHRYYQPTGVLSGRFKGVDIMEVPPVVRMLRRVRQIVTGGADRRKND